MSDQYILDENGVPVKARSLREWGQWFEQNADKRRVALDELHGSRISTVFLGLDHQWGEGPPLLYETMIFNGPEDGWCERCSTRAEAIEQHERAKAVVIGLAH